EIGVARAHRTRRPVEAQDLDQLRRETPPCHKLALPACHQLNPCAEAESGGTEATSDLCAWWTPPIALARVNSECVETPSSSRRSAPSTYATRPLGRPEAIPSTSRAGTASGRRPSAPTTKSRRDASRPSPRSASSFTVASSPAILKSPPSTSDVG